MSLPPAPVYEGAVGGDGFHTMEPVSSSLLWVYDL